MMSLIWASSRENLSSGFSKKARLKPVSSAAETSQIIAISLMASLHMVLSKKRITKALIRLRNAQAGLRLCCLHTYKDRFSRVEAHNDVPYWESYNLFLNEGQPKL